MTRYERFVLWLNRFYHKQNKITICVLYTLIMAILGVLIYGATHQQANSSISVKYTVPSYTVTFDPNGGELSTTGGGGVSSKIVKLGDTYGDLPVPTRAGYVFLGWHGRNIINLNKGYPYKNYVKYVVDGNNVTVTTEAYNGSGNEYGCAIIPIEDLTNGKYFFSFNNVSYSGDCNYPQISVMGEISAGSVGTGIYYRYDGNITSGYFDFSTLINYSGYNEYFESGGYYVSPSTAIGTSFGTGSLSFSNLMLTKVTDENEYVAYEPYYIESDTVFGTPGDRTLTAVWSSNNILTGGALQTESDLSDWITGWGTSYTPEIVTHDGLSCFKLDLTLNALSMFVQSIKGKYELGKYSITAKINVVNAVAGVYDVDNPDYTYPDLLLYFPGYYNETNWMAIFDQYDLRKYNNKGWVDIRYTSEAHHEYSDVSVNDVTFAEAQIYCRNYSGTLYIRDFAIAKM